MGMLGWVMMGLAIWHYTIFLPDRFWEDSGRLPRLARGGILAGLIIYSVKVSALEIPGLRATDVAVSCIRFPAR